MYTSKSPPELAKVRVLLVEDDEDYRYLVRRVLEEEGAVVGAVNTVDEALLEIDNFVPDVVISDLKLPERTGFDLIRDLRIRHPQIRTIALTASADQDARDLSKKAGFHVFITKPYKTPHLVSVVATQAHLKNRKKSSKARHIH